MTTELNYRTKELEAERLRIQQKVSALQICEDAYLISRQLGEKRGGWNYDHGFCGEHAGRSWNVYTKAHSVFVEVDGALVLHGINNSMAQRYDVATFREWPERDWLPAFASLSRRAKEVLRQKAVHAEKDERNRFAQAFGPINGGSFAIAS